MKEVCCGHAISVASLSSQDGGRTLEWLSIFDRIQVVDVVKLNGHYELELAKDIPPSNDCVELMRHDKLSDKNEDNGVVLSEHMAF